MAVINDFKYIGSERPVIRGAKPMSRLRIWWVNFKERRQIAKEWR